MFRQFPLIQHQTAIVWTTSINRQYPNQTSGQLQLIASLRNQLSGQFHLIDSRQNQLSGHFQSTLSKINCPGNSINRQHAQSIADTRDYCNKNCRLSAAGHARGSDERLPRLTEKAHQLLTEEANSMHIRIASLFCEIN